MTKLARRLINRLKKATFSGVLTLLMLLPTQSFPQDNQPAPKLKDVITEPSQAQKSTQNTPEAKTEPKKLVKTGPDDEYGRGVPRNSIEGFFKSTKAGDYKRAAEYLDLRNLPRGYSSNNGPELARQLKVILDRSLWVEMDLLSKEAKGHNDDGLPAWRDLVGQVDITGQKFDILLQHVPRKDGIFIWKFSSRTVRDIPELYSELGYGPIGEKLSLYLPEYEVLGLQMWQWAFLLLIALAASLATIPFIRLASWLVRRRKTGLSQMSSRFINGPLNVLLVLIITRQNFDLVHPSLTAQLFFEAGTISILIFIWLLFSIINLFHEFYSQKLRSQHNEHAIVLLAPALTTLKMIIVFLGLLVWLDNIGFRVTTVLAGLGIGGIAIALATQKSIENFIGALTLYLAAPVKVGDFCKFSDKMGTIEEIGLRATKIRTLEHTVVSVPNAEFAAMQIENLTERERYRFSPSIQLHYRTSPEQIRNILLNIKASLQAHSKIIETPLRVNFSGFGEHSLDIEIHCYIDTVDIVDFKNISEELNLHIMDIIESSASRIAIPASIEYHEQQAMDSQNLEQQARQRVEIFRNDNKQ